MPIQEKFLYSTMIENDGKVRREPTFAGVVLIGIVLIAAAWIFLILAF
jgi:hypothetical protein